MNTMGRISFTSVLLHAAESKLPAHAFNEQVGVLQTKAFLLVSLEPNEGSSRIWGLP